LTSAGYQIPRWTATRRSFDPLVERVANSRLSFVEDELLRDTHWSLGEDARLREDIRFRPTPWGRWIPAAAYLANEALFVQLHREPQRRPDIESVLADFDSTAGRRCVFCTGDPRFVVEGDTLRLSARELTNQPLIEFDIGELEKYVTHLPIHSLRAAAASLPGGEWGKSAQEEVIETLGWVRISAGRKLNSKMFVAQIEGASMDDGRSGLVDGGYAIFELWPSGTKQLLNVLVRGAFSDPETGSYAVKKYVADQRDEEGRHHRVTLVSLNSDKGRYPDIELDVESDDDVTVVAKVVQALPIEQLARRPRPVRRPGRRDLTSAESVQEIAGDLAAHTERFFESLPAEDSERAGEGRNSWRAELVCLDAESGGLHIEVGPLVGLWSFVKQMRVRGVGWDSSKPAANVRLRPVRVSVPPGTGPWKWEAIGFEDDADVDFSALAIAALPADSAVVFRVDAASVGRLIANRVLSIGQHYRLLIPDPAFARLTVKPPVAPAGPGWSLWEVELSSASSADVRTVLRDFGLEIGESEARLDWTLVPPVAWDTSPKGVPYPCFLPSPDPAVVVDGPEIETHGSASLFLHGPGGHEVLPLPSGRRHLVRLQGLVPGQYSVMVLHDRTGVSAERLAFEVVTLAPAGPVAQCQVTTMGESAILQPGRVSVLSAHDLAVLDALSVHDGQPDLFVKAPPGWPVRVSWRELVEDSISSTHADRDGVVDSHTVLDSTRERRNRRSMGDLVFDFAELGAAIVRHERRATPAAIRNRIQELVVGRESTVQRLAGIYEELLPIWFEPVCSALGYDVEVIAVNGLAEAPEHVSAFRLLHTERHLSRIERRPVRVLLLAKDLSKALSDNLLRWIDDLCESENLREVLVSDGLRWAGHRRTSRLTPRIWDLTEVVTDADEFVAFLREASEGV